MGLSVKQGTFVSETATGNKAYTGIGFQPSLVIFINNKLTTTGNAADSNLGIGFALSSSSRVACAGYSQDGVLPLTTDIGRRQDNTKCLIFVQGSGSVSTAADFVSLDADGFTLNYTTVAATAWEVQYIALGGTDITNTKIGSIQAKTSNGSQATSGLGFQPDCLIFIGIGDQTAAPDSQDTRNGLSISFITGSNQNAFSGAATYNGAQATAGCYGGATTVLLYADTSVQEQAALTSIDSDGFTLNYTTTDGVPRYYFYLAIKGGSFAVGNFAQPGSTGNQNITGLSFQPNITLFGGVNYVTDTGPAANRRNFLGVATSSSVRSSMWSGDTGGSVVTAVASSSFSTSKCILAMTEAGASPTTQAAADFVSQNSDGFTVNWSSADATARTVFYLAIGNTPPITKTGSQTLDVTVTEVSSVVVALSRTDSLDTTLTESSTNLLISSRTDSLDISLTEISTNTLFLITSEILNINLNETSLIFDIVDEVYFRRYLNDVNRTDTSAINSITTVASTTTDPTETYLRRYLNDI